MKFSAILLVVPAFWISALEAATIITELTVPPVYTNFDISENTVDWAYFGSGSDPTSVIRKSGGPGSISAVTGAGGAGSDSRIFLGFDGGDTVPSITVGRDFAFAPQSSTGSLSFTTTILSANQTIHVYLTG